MPNQSRQERIGKRDAPPASARPAASNRLRLSQIFSLLLGIFGAALILLRSPHAAGFLAPAPDNSSLTIQGIRKMDQSEARQRLSRMEQPGGLRSQPVEPGPLWVANLACRVGDYVVSVRRVRIPHYTWDDNPPPAFRMTAPTPFYLSLQVMATRSGSLKQIQRVADDFTVTDSEGKRLKPAAHQDFAFPNGRGCRFALSPTRAAFLRRVDGVITLAGSGGRLAFHIDNVPVPWTTHIFGVAGSALASGQSAAALRLPALPLRAENNAAAPRPFPYSALAIRDPKQVEAIVQQMPQAAFEAPDLRLPNRFVIQPNTSGSLLLPLASENSVPSADAPSLQCALSVQPTTDGEMRVQIQLAREGQPAIRETLSVWDNAPLALVIPAQTLDHRLPADARVVIYLHLFLDSSLPLTYAAASTPQLFRAGKGERGGVLAGRVAATGEAFGSGYAVLSLTRVENGRAVIDAAKDAKQRGTKASEGVERINAPLDREGQFALSNLTAGTYRIVLEQVTPIISYAAVKGPPGAYLKHRLHIANPVVKNAAQTARVRPGGHTSLAEWVYQEEQALKPPVKPSL